MSFYEILENGETEGPELEDLQTKLATKALEAA